jgi:hypothetical protein
MSKKVFVSYCHRQGKWVWHRLVPCLKAGGAEVFVDRERFEAGKGVVGQMDATQDAADMSVLVLAPEYLSSPYCRHEMERAIARDPRFRKGCVIPVRRAPCALPDVIKLPNPLYVDLCNDKDAAAWKLLLDSCGADLGATAPDWLKARDDVVRFLRRNQSVNLVVKGHPRYRQLIHHIREDFQPELGIVDLDQGPTASRPGLVAEILTACGAPASVPPVPGDLAVLHRVLSARPGSAVALLHFDHVQHREYYDVDLFSALRVLLMDSRKLVLLAQSRTPFAALLPKTHPLSSIDMKTVELQGQPV